MKRAHRKEKSNSPKPARAEKQCLHLRLPFTGDTISDIITNRISNAVNNKFYAAQLRISFATSPAITQHLKDRLPTLNSSFCIYQFTCSCGAGYIGKTTRRLSDRVNEHCPAWLCTGSVKSVRSAIVAHLVQSNHQISKTDSFRLLHRVPGHYSRFIRCRVLAAAEAVAIRLYNPSLCSHKQFVKSLDLPWTAPHSTRHTNLLDLSARDSPNTIHPPIQSP
jgi:hypothetical protein